MGYLTPDGAAALLARHDRPITTFVETGTHVGRTLYPIYQSKLFRVVHSIELSATYFAEAWQRTKDLPDFGTGLILHHGDSAEVLKTLAPSIHEPAVFWLDAHWYPEEHVAQASPCPLFAELATIRARSYADLVVIDDVQCFARKWHDGPGADWSHISQASILATFEGRVASSYVVDEKFAIHLR